MKGSWNVIFMGPGIISKWIVSRVKMLPS
jgi:hypothetical protein